MNTTHPLLGTGPEWRVTNFISTVELYRSEDRVTAVIAKPIEAQSPEWWREQAQRAITEATKPKTPAAKP